MFVLGISLLVVKLFSLYYCVGYLHAHAYSINEAPGLPACIIPIKVNLCS